MYELTTLLILRMWLFSLPEPFTDNTDVVVVMEGSKGKERFRRPLRQLKLRQKKLPFPPRALLTNHGFDTDP